MLDTNRQTGVSCDSRRNNAIRASYITKDCFQFFLVGFQGHREYWELRGRKTLECVKSQICRGETSDGTKTASSRRISEMRNCERSSEGVKHRGCRSAAAGQTTASQFKGRRRTIRRNLQNNFCDFVQLGSTQPVSRFQHHALSALMEVCGLKQSLGLIQQGGSSTFNQRSALTVLHFYFFPF